MRRRCAVAACSAAALALACLTPLAALSALAPEVVPPAPSAEDPPPNAATREAGNPAPAGAAQDAGKPEASAAAAGRLPDGRAVALEEPTSVLQPFGHGRPVLRCAPLRACVIELEPAELVLATAAGDSERWLIQAASSGQGGRTPIVVVKPTACDLSTNLVIATDRRIYEVALDSPPCRGADAAPGSYNPSLPYTGLTRFYYPDELVHRQAREEQAARQRAEQEAAGRTALSPTARLARLNFDYVWKRGRRYPWAPAQVFDDGEHTYIVLPPAARFAEAPVLFVLGPDGAPAILNYRLENQTYIADRVLARAVLVVGRRGEQRLEITNRGAAARR